MRRKSKAKTNNVLGIKHKDLISYTYKKVNAKKCKLIWKFTKIY